MKLVKIIGMFILVMLIMILAQGVGGAVEAIIPYFGIGTILFAAIYILLSFIFTKWFVHKFLKVELVKFRIKKPRFRLIYVLLGLLLPVLVYGFYLLFIPGSFSVESFQSIHRMLKTLFWLIFINALAAAIVEEMLCRGLLMGYLEQKTNSVIAITTTAIFFGLIHLLNGPISITSFLMLLISGTFVGIMFGLATYTFNTIWASITLHFLWNLAQILFITDKEENNQIFQYVVNSDNLLLTGGQFGMEASIVSILGYSIIIIFLLIILKQKHSKI